VTGGDGTASLTSPTKTDSYLLICTFHGNLMGLWWSREHRRPHSPHPGLPVLVSEWICGGTTRIGPHVVNRSFMIPGLVATLGAVAVVCSSLNSCEVLASTWPGEAFIDPLPVADQPTAGVRTKTGIARPVLAW
jgi:hypothetical protein